jgi:serine phosphatase RsbU (regulator of sigma subunit)
MVLRADGTLERVGVAGDLLGLFSEVRLFEETVQLGLGDTLVMFTDGVTEARRAGEELGERGLARLLTEAVGGTGQQLVDHVLDGVLAFGGDQSRDDIAVLAVQASPRQPTS